MAPPFGYWSYQFRNLTWDMRNNFIKNKMMKCAHITYIIGHYNPSVRFIIDLVSRTTYVVCVLILFISGETYSLKSTPNDMAILFYSQSLFQKSAKRKSLKNFFFHISFWWPTWNTNMSFTSNKPTHWFLFNRFVVFTAFTEVTLPSNSKEVIVSVADW